MMGFLEFAAWRQNNGLPDPVAMLLKLGIDPHGPREVDVMRMVKDEKKRSGGSAPAKASSRHGVARTIAPVAPFSKG
jgi:hypothetical protein